jgi:hypothetical protein
MLTQSGSCAGENLVHTGIYVNVPVLSLWQAVLVGRRSNSSLLVQRLTVVGYNPLLSVLYLRDNSSNSNVTGVCVYHEHTGLE